MNLPYALVLLLCAGFGGAAVRSVVRGGEVGVGIFGAGCALGLAAVTVAYVVVGG